MCTSERQTVDTLSTTATFKCSTKPSYTQNYLSLNSVAFFYSHSRLFVSLCNKYVYIHIDETFGYVHAIASQTLIYIVYIHIIRRLLFSVAKCDWARNNHLEVSWLLWDWNDAVCRVSVVFFLFSSSSRRSTSIQWKCMRLSRAFPNIWFYYVHHICCAFNSVFGCFSCACFSLHMLWILYSNPANNFQSLN